MYLVVIEGLLLPFRPSPLGSPSLSLSLSGHDGTVGENHRFFGMLMSRRGRPYTVSTTAISARTCNWDNAFPPSAPPAPPPLHEEGIYDAPRIFALRASFLSFVESTRYAMV